MLLSYFTLLLTCSSAVTAISRRQGTDAPTGTVDPSTITDCTYWVNPSGGDTCDSIITQFDGLLTLDQFISYNPSVGRPCTLKEGYSYCLEQNWGIPPTPTPSPTPSISKTVIAITTCVPTVLYSTITYTVTPTPTP